MTAFSSFYEQIRAAVGDYGKTGSNGSVDTSTYQFTDNDLNGAITLYLLELSSYTKDDGAYTFSPDMTDKNEQGQLVWSIALNLAVADPTKSHKTRDLAILMEKDPQIAYIVSQILKFEGKVDIPRAEDGAMYALADQYNRVEDFVGSLP